MEPRTFVSFEWSDPDDAEFDDSGNVISPAGKRVLNHLKQELVRQGFQVTEAEMHSDYGWWIEVISEKVPVWCMIQGTESWLVITEVPLSFLHWVLARKPRLQHSRVCLALHEALISSTKAKVIQWFGRRQFEQSRGQGGADRP